MISQIFLSSGDVIADRRFEWGAGPGGKGRSRPGRRTAGTELTPGYASAWFVLGQLREMLGNRVGAITAFEHATVADSL